MSKFPSFSLQVFLWQFWQPWFQVKFYAPFSQYLNVNSTLALMGMVFVRQFIAGNNENNNLENTKSQHTDYAV